MAKESSQTTQKLQSCFNKQQAKDLLELKSLQTISKPEQPFKDVSPKLRWFLTISLIQTKSMETKGENSLEQSMFACCFFWIYFC